MTDMFQQVLGDELRKARKLRGWTRHQLQQRLPSPISLQTLATYEMGTRQCTVTRLLELCLALQVSAPELLTRVHERTTPADGLRVDLLAVVADARPALRPLRRWAQERLDHTVPGRPTVVHLDSPALASMAQLCAMDAADLIAALQESRQ